MKTAKIGLSPEETLLLQEHESTISRGLQEFVAIGQSLRDIRDKKLYRAGHKTFEAYCKKRWNISRPHAYRLIEAAATVEDLSPDWRQKVENESQARALAAVPLHLREEVLERIEAAGESVTEQVVTRIVLELLDEQRAGDKEEEPEPEEQPAKKPRGQPPKRLLYVPRGHEQQRLALKDAMLASVADVKTKKAQEIVRRTIELAKATAARWEELLAETATAAA